MGRTEKLLEGGADLDICLKGLVWGKGFAWETAIFDLTPASSAQCGVQIQFHRKEGNGVRQYCVSRAEKVWERIERGQRAE